MAPVAGLPKTKDLDSIYRQYALDNTKEPLSRSLDLGCGSKPRNPFEASQLFGVDIRSLPDLDIHAADLCIEPIPFENDFFDCITAYDFIEHIPRVIYNPECRFPFVALMNEVLRVLKPGGIFFSQTPLYPFCVSMSDPTHVNYITTETFPNYFCGKTCLGGMYGFHGHFDLLYQGRFDSHLISILRKPSDLIAPKSHSFA
jgi:SAM-dependent methyltransferase